MPQSILPARILIVRPDAETETIGEIAAVLKIPVVKVGVFNAPYAVSDCVPLAGDLWIECSLSFAVCPTCAGSGDSGSGGCPTCGGHRHLSGKEVISLEGGCWIDHHNPGDVPPRYPAFAASSLGQFIVLLGRAAQAGEVAPEVLATLPGLQSLDDPNTYTFERGLNYFDGPTSGV